MARDKRVIFYGEDVADYGGAFKVTKGLLEAFGRDRVFNTPISEACICGTACGAAMNGLRPVVELMYFDFALMSSDQISNQAAKWHYMSGAQTEVPLVIRASAGAGKGYGGQHSQTLESMFCHIPGLYVVYPATPYDAKGMLKSAIRDNNPVLFVESQALYGMKGPVPEGEYLVPLGVADVKREGSGHHVRRLGPAGPRLPQGRRQAEGRTGRQRRGHRPAQPRSAGYGHRAALGAEDRAVAWSPARPIHIGSYTGEIASTIQELAFDYLDAPVKRVGAKNGIAPQSHILEAAFLPNVERHARRRQLHPLRHAMATPIIMPKFGQMTEESAIVEWLQEGRRQGCQGRHSVHRRDRQVGHGGRKLSRRARLLKIAVNAGRERSRAERRRLPRRDPARPFPRRRRRNALRPQARRRRRRQQLPPHRGTTLARRPRLR